MSGKKKAALFESDSDSEEEPKAGTSKSGSSGFTINESYANIYDGFRRKEQLQKLKDRYGDNAGEGDGDDDDDETSSSSEDEDAEEITKENEVEFFAAIAALKKKASSQRRGLESYHIWQHGPRDRELLCFVEHSLYDRD